MTYRPSGCGFCPMALVRGRVGVRVRVRVRVRARVRDLTLALAVLKPCLPAGLVALWESAVAEPLSSAPG